MNRHVKRKVNENFDLLPSLHHIFNYETSLPYIKNKTILDVGCWSGQYIHLAVNAAKISYGVDPDLNAILMAKKQTPKAIFKVGSVLKIPFKSNFFDVVIFSDVIEHIPKNSESLAIQEIYRVLKPKGILILTTPRNHLLSILFDPAYFLIGHRHYSLNFLKSLLKEQNFYITKLFFYRGIISLLAANVETFFKFIVNKKPNFPKFVTYRLRRELTSKGFASICIIAKKQVS